MGHAFRVRQGMICSAGSLQLQRQGGWQPLGCTGRQRCRIMHCMACNHPQPLLLHKCAMCRGAPSCATQHTLQHGLQLTCRTAAKAEQDAACPLAACLGEQPHCNMSPAAAAEGKQDVGLLAGSMCRGALCCTGQRCPHHRQLLQLPAAELQQDAGSHRAACPGGHTAWPASNALLVRRCRLFGVLNCNSCCCRSAARSGQPSGSMCRATSSPTGPPKWRRRTTS